MPKKYSTKRMNEKELQAIEQVLLEQVEIQRWFVVEVVGEIELVITLQ
ncbi:MAG: hypothetical protein WBD36_01070 [Bacteroidota bacterium]